jgi:hypothetical protein
MERSIYNSKQTTPNALISAASQMMISDRGKMNNNYDDDKNGWEAGDVQREYDGTYSMANMSTRRSTHAVTINPSITSPSIPIINGNMMGFQPITSFPAPFFMQVQYPVAQIDMDWYIRQCK